MRSLAIESVISSRPSVLSLATQDYTTIHKTRSMMGSIYLFCFGKGKSLVVMGRQLDVQNIRLIASQQRADPTKHPDVALKRGCGLINAYVNK